MQNDVTDSHEPGRHAQDILDEMERWHLTNTGAADAEPRCLMIVGPVRAGKTHLIRTHMQRHPPQYVGATVHRPVCLLTVPYPPTSSSMASALLFSLGDPKAATGTLRDKTQRIVNYFKACEVKMLIVDEIHYIVEDIPQRMVMGLGNWLMALVKDTGVACVLVGLQGKAEMLLRCNTQLARLFGEVRVLATFEGVDRQREMRLGIGERWTVAKSVK